MAENDDEGTAEEYGIETYVYYRRRPFSREAFVTWAKENAHYIIRSKGVLYFSEDPSKRCVYETAGRQIKLTELGLWYSENHTPQEIENLRRHNKFFEHDYDEVWKEKLVKLVFIGQHLDKKAIKAELDRI